MRLFWNIAIAVTALGAAECLASAEMTGNDEIALPVEVYIEGGSSHVQGLALDEKAGRMYFSFTTSFVKTDLEGRVLGSIDRIQGHLGAMTFDPRERKVYATLECKDDVIGASLSAFAKGRSMFYVAIIDVDRIDRIGMDSASGTVPWVSALWETVCFISRRTAAIRSPDSSSAAPVSTAGGAMPGVASRG